MYSRILMSRQSYGLDVKLQYTSNYVDLICILIRVILVLLYLVFPSPVMDFLRVGQQMLLNQQRKTFVVFMLEVFETICQCARILPHSECVVSVRCVCVCKRLWGVMIQAPAYLQVVLPDPTLSPCSLCLQATVLLTNVKTC